MEKVSRWFYAAIGVTVLFFAGMVYAWSVLSAPIANEFPEWTKAQLSLTFTLMIMMFCVGCIVGGFWAEKISARSYILISALMFLSGFFLSAKIHSLIELYINFGVICGLASGLAYSAVMGTITKWFPDRQGLISGVLLMGFGIGSFFIGKIYQVFTPDLTGAWRRSFEVLGVTTALVLAACSIFVKKPELVFSHPAMTKKKECRANLVSMEIASHAMVKRLDFWLYYLWATLVGSAGLALVSQAGGIAHEAGTGVSAGAITTVVGLISIFNGIGRVIMGVLFDRMGRSTTMQIVNCMFILTGIILAVALKTGSFIVMTAGFILGGLAYGGVTPTNSAFTSSYFGMKHYPKNFSIVNTNAFIAAFGSTAAGAIYDVTQSYLNIYFMICGLALIGIAASLAINLCDRKTLRQKRG